MKTKLALLCYRVARWLAPLLFRFPPKDITGLRMRRNELTRHYDQLVAKKRNGLEGTYVAHNIQNLTALLRATEAIGAQYEQVKVEIAFDPSTHILTQRDRKRLKDDPTLSTLGVIHEDGKRLLFAAIVEGFAKSPEVDKFLYFAKYPSGAKTIGIRLYMRHEDAAYDSGARSQVGNYTKDIKPKKDEQ